MYRDKLQQWCNSGCSIREMAAYGAQRAETVGAENVFNFTIGDPSIEPPACVHECIERLMKTMSPTKLHSYAPASGLPQVREKFARYLTETFSVDYSMEDITVTNGASTALSVLINSLVSSGDRVITLTPYFSYYRFYVDFAGGELKEVPSAPDTFQVDLDAVTRAITPNTTVMILNSPNNPSGAVLSRESIQSLAQLLETKEKEYGHPIYVIADEPYRDLVYGGVEVPFIPAYYRNTIYCYSFSKSLSLPGDRIGFMAVSKNVDNYAQIQSKVAEVYRAFGYICVTPMFQMVAAECIGKTSDISIYEANRNVLYSALLDMGYHCVRPDGAFYIFLKTPGGDSIAFCAKAMEHDLLMVPGEDFGCPGYARIAYCVTKEQIQRSLPVFQKLAEIYELK